MLKTVGFTIILLLQSQVIYVCNAAVYLDTLIAKQEDPLKPTEQEMNAVRCSRRYNPGNCGTWVTTVWTYSWQLQNCTERMGCTIGTRSNRFRSYTSCRRICDPLVDIYTRFLEHPSANSLRERTDKKLTPEEPGPRTVDPDHLPGFPTVLRSTISPEDVEEDYQLEDRELGEDPQELDHHGLWAVDVDMRY